MPFPATGGYRALRHTQKVIRLAGQGCANRPFYHIVVMEQKQKQHDHVMEQIGTYDPLTNQYNEKLVTINFERLRYWIGMGAETSRPVEELLGIVGFFPIHPGTYMLAWRNRKAAEEKASAAVAEDANKT